MRHLVQARIVAAALLREREMSYPAIARLLGRSDHTSAIHWVRCAAERADEAAYQALYQAVRAQLQQHRAEEDERCASS
jgi:chromosomal replication initiation ATPase DnaA